MVPNQALLYLIFSKFTNILLTYFLFTFRALLVGFCIRLTLRALDLKANSGHLAGLYRQVIDLLMGPPLDVIIFQKQARGSTTCLFCPQFA